MSTGRWVRTVAVAAALAAAAVVPAPAPVAAAPTGTPRGVVIAPLRVLALPGFRSSTSGPQLNPATFTPVASLVVPATPAARTVVLGATITVSVPTRIALSVLGTCRAAGAASDSRDVLVIGQNPYTGSTPTAVASRTVSGRAVVDVPAATALTCVLRVSPRTETTARSWLQVTGGRFAAAPATVFARATQRRSVMVGIDGARGAGGSRRAVAVMTPTAVPAGTVEVRAHGEAELTTCALGYRLCGRGRSGPSVLDLRLHGELATSQGVCRRLDGTSVRVTIDAAMHHRKVLLPMLVLPASCSGSPTWARVWIVVTWVRGNAAEVEPLLSPSRVQTHAFLIAAH